MADVVVIVPVLRRPHRAALVAASLEAATPGGAARLLFVATEDDIAEIEAVKATGADLMILPGNHDQGQYSKKINYGYQQSTEPLLFLGADDLDFHPGWLAAARAHLTDTIAVVGTNDLGNPRVMRGEHATHFLVARWYADRYGTIDRPRQVLHEGYWHETCDDELVATARHRGAWSFAMDSHVEHLHPHWHPEVPSDELYDKQHIRMVFGRQVYLSRRHMWGE